MSLWDVLVDYWIWIQLCRLRGVGISAHQTTAQFDMDCFFFPFLPAIAAFLPQRFPPYQKWPSYDGLASCECQTALWLFNEAIRHREPQLLQPLLVLKQEIKTGEVSLQLLLLAPAFSGLTTPTLRQNTSEHAHIFSVRIKIEVFSYFHFPQPLCSYLHRMFEICVNIL